MVRESARRSRVEGRGSRVEGRGSRVAGRGSRVAGRGSRGYDAGCGGSVPRFPIPRPKLGPWETTEILKPGSRAKPWLSLFVGSPIIFRRRNALGWSPRCAEPPSPLSQTSQRVADAAQTLSWPISCVLLVVQCTKWKHRHSWPSSWALYKAQILPTASMPAARRAD
jgi:hypothetical protein